jgi:EmrB/QacA subfamily drug resistance transporter
MLVATRVLQGLGGGMLMPIGMAVLYRLSPPDRRGAIMGLFGIPVMLAPALGPLLSGYLLEFANWRFIFLINLPVGIIALLVGLRALPALPPGRLPGRLDTVGVILGPLAFTLLSFGISQSTFSGWTAPTTLGGITLGLIALAFFVWRELSVSDPVLELRVFKGRDFSIAVLIQWAGFGTMFATFFLVPLFLQQVRGYGPFETGLFVLPQAVASAIFMQIGGRVFDRLGPRPPVVFGLTLVVVSMYLMTKLTGTTTGEDLRLPLILMGAGLGSMIMSLNTHILNAAPRDLVGRVTSLTNALQNVVSSLAIATFATILAAQLQLHTAAATALTSGQPTPAQLTNASAQAFGDVYLVATVIVSIGWCLAWTLRPIKPGTPALDDQLEAVGEPPGRELVGVAG